METKPADAVVWVPAPQEHFTGNVWFGALVGTDVDSGLQIVGVRFAARARTHWHSHPQGQILYVISGSALVGTRSGEVARIEPGGSVYALPGEQHWHGAAGDSDMVHLSLTRGEPTVWLGEPVPGDTYPAPAADSPSV